MRKGLCYAFPLMGISFLIGLCFIPSTALAIAHPPKEETAFVPLPAMVISASVTISPNDAWIAGEYNVNGPNPCYENCYSLHTSPFFEHWDGQQWKLVPPLLASDYVYAEAMAAIGPNNVWLVGTYEEVTPGESEFLIEHWNGHVWSILTPAFPGDYVGGDSEIKQVFPFSQKNVMVTGVYSNGQQETNLTETWDGSQWSVAN